MRVEWMRKAFNGIEQINEMLVKMKNMEKEKAEMQRQYRLLEEELDTRRREIFVLKQENNVQYMMEERENWKAMIAQQKHMNAKLEKGTLGFLH